MKHADAVIIGGGPAGSTAALLLARAGWSVVLLERKSFPRRKVCGEYLSFTNWSLFDLLGVGRQLAEVAGPGVCKVGLYVGRHSAAAPLPPPRIRAGDWGRAIAREHLDTLLLQEAARGGVDVRQPCRCLSLEREGNHTICRVEARPSGETTELCARMVIAAHGSWDPGDLGTQPRRVAPRPGELFGFKAHFDHSGLEPGLMPLVSFANGYGGLVHCGPHRISLSCCIRRDRLERLHHGAGQSAGEAVLSHILESCPAVRPILENARRDGPWLAVGPIQPGLRAPYRNGVFVIGNAAGEAHPVVAEGISMAMQSAWLLAERLIDQPEALGNLNVRRRVGQAYRADWRRSFAPRVRAAAAIAHWAMRPKLVLSTLPAIRRYPHFLTWGARASGKARQVVY